MNYELFLQTRSPGICFTEDVLLQLVTGEGKEITNSVWREHGIELIIPPGAVPAGEEIMIQVHCCFTGPFFIPSGYKSYSPVYIISPSVEFMKEVELRIYHHAFLRTQEDCARMTFVTGSSLPTTDEHGVSYHFQVQEGGLFKPHPDQPIATLHLKHFCMKSVVGSEVPSKCVRELYCTKTCIHCTSHCTIL